MRKVAKNVAVVQASHGDLGDNHFQEGGEGGENTELALVETETSCRGEVATLHDAGRNEDLWVLLVDNLQTGRALQVTCSYVSGLNDDIRIDTTYYQSP